MTHADNSSGYDSMMKDVEDTIQSRDRDSDTNLRELLNTRRKVWDLYPRIGALEDSLMRIGGEDSEDIARLLDEYKGTASHPPHAYMTSSYGSATDLGHSASNPEHHTSTYSTSYRPTAGAYGTTTSARYQKPSSASYRKKEYDFEKSSLRGYKPGNRVGEKWDTQSMVNVNVPVGKTKYTKSRVPHTQSYRSTGYGGRARKDDFETTSVRSYRGDDDGADLESLLRWKTQGSAHGRSIPAWKTYDDWSPPRYSRRAPLNAYIYEPDLTTSYQSPRTLVDRDELGLDDEEDSDIMLSRYSKVPLTETAVRRHDFETSYSPYVRHYGDYSVAGSYAGVYDPVAHPYKFETRSHTPETRSFTPMINYYNYRPVANPYKFETSSYTPVASTHKFETSSYTPKTSPFKPMVSSCVPVTRSKSKYAAATSRHNPITTPVSLTTTTTKTKRRNATTYQESPTKTTYGRPVNVSKEYKPAKVTKAKVTFETVPPPSSYRNKYESTPRRYVDTLDTRPPRYPARSATDDDMFSDIRSAASYPQKIPDTYYRSSSRKYDTYTSQVPRAVRKVDEKPRTVPTVYSPSIGKENDLHASRHGRHFPLGIYKGDPEFYNKGEGDPAQDVTLSHLFNILNAQTKVLSECVSKL